jgi:hypothetical protein
MPQLAALYKKYEPEGFHIVGLEAQGSAEDAIKNLANGKSATYQITTGGRLNGSTGNGLPQGYLFDANGNLVDGEARPHGQFESKLKELLKDVAGSLAGPGPYKKLAPVIAQLKAGMPFSTALKALQPKLQSKDAEEAAEAKLMVDSIRTNGNEMITQALAKKSSDPVVAVTKLDKVAMQFSGDEIGTKAKTESDTMKKDPAIKKEIDAELMWKKIAVMNDALKPVRGVKDPKDEAFKKQNMAAIQGVIGGCMALTKQFAGTKAAAKAEELMSDYK